LGNVAEIAERNQVLLHAQQRARGVGPTPEVFFGKHLDNSRPGKGPPDPVRGEGDAPLRHRR